MSFIFYLFSLYYYVFPLLFFFHVALCWCALVLSLISAHYRISSRLILNVAVIIKRAAAEVQLVFVPGFWTDSTTNHILSAPLPGPDRCLHETNVHKKKKILCIVLGFFFCLLGQFWLGLFSHFQSFLTSFKPCWKGFACSWAHLAGLRLKLPFCQYVLESAF